MTSSWCTMDVAEAFLNDPYDWEGPKDPFVCATEADMDGGADDAAPQAPSGTPVLFADVRHYHRTWASGTCATPASTRRGSPPESSDPAENMARVNLYPEVFYFPAGGASVQHVAAPGQATFARLSRLSGRYRMQVLTRQLRGIRRRNHRAAVPASTFEWPHAFARFDAPADEILARFGANHIHAVPGDHVDGLRTLCRLLDVDFDGFGTSA